MTWTNLGVTGFGFFLTLAFVDASKRLLPNNARHKLTPNPTGASVVVVLDRIVVLDLAVITIGILVVVIGIALDCINAGVLASMYFFVVDTVLLTLGDWTVDENGNKSIIIGSEDDSNDEGFLIVLMFEFTVLIAFGDRVGPGLANASSKIYRK